MLLLFFCPLVGFSLRVGIADPGGIESRPLFFILNGLKLLVREVSPLFLILVFPVLTHIQGLIVLPCEFLLSFQFVSDCLIDPSSAPSSFDVGCFKTPHESFVECNSVLVGVFFWTGQNSLILDL